MNRYLHPTAILLSVILGVAGCASTPQISREQVMMQNDSVARLHDALQSARGNDADLLAPNAYEDANQQLDKALKAGAHGDSQAASAAASRGLDRLDTADSDIATSREMFREVLDNRSRAMDAGAAGLYPDLTAKLDAQLREAAGHVEHNEPEAAKQQRPDLITGYRQLELKALKESTVDKAEAALNNAKGHEANKYAPKTYNLGLKEYKLAQSILEADRSNTATAQQHAERARWLADRSVGITELVRDFDRRDYSPEDIVLWYQSQLSDVGAPLDTRLPFDESNNDVVTALRSDVNDLVSQRNTASQERMQYEQELARQSSQEHALEQVQSMFAAFEANVYQKQNDLVISAHGLHFAPGKSQLQSEDYGLLNKIRKAIDTFPDSTVRVTGYTDSSGSSALNKQLSQQRAASVARFLSQAGDISSDRLIVSGKGEAEPVATNATAAGRAENRRVEIVIER